METKTALSRLPTLIKAKRRKEMLGLRAAAVQSGISPSTLSRLERGFSPTLPDTETLSKITIWLDISLDEIISPNTPKTRSTKPEFSTPEFVEIHLRADKNLSPETAKSLADMFSLLYKQFTEKQKN